jgi:hypothetical protein
VTEIPEPPPGLAEVGAALWSEILDEVELSPDGLAMLAEVCRTVDELELMGQALRAGTPTVLGSKGQPIPNGLFAELRAHRLLLVKLLDELALPEEDEQVGKTPNQKRASGAAKVRWDMERKRRGRTG